MVERVLASHLSFKRGLAEERLSFSRESVHKNIRPDQANMGIQTSDPQAISNTHLGSSESIGEASIILIAVGSILIILCAASIIYGLHRRKRQGTTLTGGILPLTNETSHNPTDFMKSLATWDRCHSIDKILENRRRSVWTLEIFENYGSSDVKTENIKSPSDS